MCNTEVKAINVTRKVRYLLVVCIYEREREMLKFLCHANDVDIAR